MKTDILMRIQTSVVRIDEIVALTPYPTNEEDGTTVWLRSGTYVHTLAPMTDVTEVLEKAGFQMSDLVLPKDE